MTIWCVCLIFEKKRKTITQRTEKSHTQLYWYSHCDIIWYVQFFVLYCRLWKKKFRALKLHQTYTFSKRKTIGRTPNCTNSCRSNTYKKHFTINTNFDPFPSRAINTFYSLLCFWVSNNYRASVNFLHSINKHVKVLELSTSKSHCNLRHKKYE